MVRIIHNGTCYRLEYNSKYKSWDVFNVNGFVGCVRCPKSTKPKSVLKYLEL